VRLSTKLVTVIALVVLTMPLSAQVLTYKYDDGSFEQGVGNRGYGVQVAQRFELQQPGTIRWLEACFWRGTTDPQPEHEFTFDIHSSDGDTPGPSLLRNMGPTVQQRLSRDNRVYCNRAYYSHTVPAGDTWVSVQFLGDEGILEEGGVGEGKFLAADTSGPSARLNGTSNRQVTSDGRGAFVFGAWGDLHYTLWYSPLGIRIGVEHGGSQPPPPDPDPPDQDPCAPTTDVLDLDGYRVRMCYVTPDGDTGQARAGVWASSQSGILWFFDRENAEVLVKVLDGCRHNDYRWVFVAPVTTLAFRLLVTAPDGRTWNHTNEAGATASTKSDTSAFRCQ